MPLGIQLLIALVVGGLIGFCIGWFRGRNRAGAGDSRLEAELRQQLGQRENEIATLRGELTQANTARAAADAHEEAARKLLSEQRELHERTLCESREAQEKALADLRSAFKALSVDTLRELQPHFIERVSETVARLQETARGDLKERQEAIKTLVEPLKQHLDTYQKRLQQAENAQATTLGEVKKQLETLTHQSQTLAQETQQFRMVLRSNQARGRWGEETLRRVVEAAGMSAHCDFSEQAQSGDAKPDLIVHLPGERMIIVDSKVPDLDFLTAMESAETGKRAEALAAHARKLKETIKALAERDYPRQFANALDYVVLFLPAESLFSAALEGDQDLIVWAASKRILLTTPASLIALLRSVSVSWQQHAQTENARDIAEAAQELYTRVCKFVEHFDKIRTGLARANDAFNDAVGSYERMVRPSGEKLAKLSGGMGGRELPDGAPLDVALRLPPVTGAASRTGDAPAKPESI